MYGASHHYIICFGVKCTCLTKEEKFISWRTKSDLFSYFTLFQTENVWLLLSGSWNTSFIYRLLQNVCWNQNKVHLIFTYLQVWIFKCILLLPWPALFYEFISCVVYKLSWREISMVLTDVILDPLLSFRKELIGIGIWAYLWATSFVSIQFILWLTVPFYAYLEKHGVKVSVNDIVIKAVAVALRNVPEANGNYHWKFCFCW